MSTEAKLTPREDEDFGYPLYYDRTSPQMSDSASKSCERDVTACFKKHPELDLISRALRRHGCELNLRRHVSCERCAFGVMGGFDSNTNQVVICQNNSATRAMRCSTLLHELIHAFDKCRARVDFSNIHHLACTEIRAAAFTKCSLMSKIINGYKNHEDCTRTVAENAIRTVRNVTQEEASQAVSDVFTRCYNDTEPFGRHFMNLKKDPQNCLSENEKYGYSQAFSHFKEQRQKDAG